MARVVNTKLHLMKGRVLKGPIIKAGTRQLLSIALLLSTVSLSYAATLYKWIDDDGNVVYQDTPPPSSVNFEEQTYVDEGGFENEITRTIDQAAEDNPISFYSISNCEACDLVRLYLENLSLPYSEKDIENSVTIQQELRDLTGQLRVPTLAIGGEIIDGYSKQGIRRLLLDGGYPLEDIEAGSLDSAQSSESGEGQQNEQQAADTEQAAANQNEGEVVDPEEFNYDQLEEISSSAEPVVEIEQETESDQ